ncbi:type IV toxin-antitoxin system AbiEi family antitoxin domain-containing protein [Herbiconiux ginsengi]|uniref:Transcriptional regulator, AbiEi antitoxin, Type IV TA system n=1 Tax=Herbiconiux ginsengi TaxID=381665 RepID=A0A1H3SSC2_9MICO|nr:type IV toxin-antitoxin system AbiEi family antitoxin domain-containing protein [Herbiconiux ginsengi]SDZ40445.1 Transcriptional regulator, AbiEi antitoxin, Type IV TA system [Herbiconiux ginsengi]
MHDSLLRSIPPISTTRQLSARNVSPARLREAVGSGTLRRVRRGVFATPDAPEALVRAARMGGRLTDVSALRLLGVWVPPDDRLHVELARSSGHPKDPDSGEPFVARADTVAHWTNESRSGNPYGLVPIARALRQAATTWEPDYVVAAIDSALHQKLTTRAELASAFLGSTRALQVLSHTDARAESGTESVARFRLSEAGIDAAVQVWMTASIRVDLLVDGWLVIEVDGREFHGTADASSRDCRRDAILTRQGSTVLHFDYRQVMFEWHTVIEAIRRVLFAGPAAAGSR